MNEPVIEIKNLCCKAGNKYLLRDINWQVNKGEHWVVFGMNGSGKTTLLSIIAGFKHYTAGEVKVFGESFTNENMLEHRKRIGLVSGSFFDKQYSKESILDVVLSGKTGSLGLDYSITLEDVRLAKSLLTELGLEDKFYHGFDMLSKGQRQNVMIARALMTNPDILILDEPCSGLDIYNRSYLFSTINELSKRKDLTIIYVTHYVEEIIPLFDKTLFLKYGHIFKTGSTQEMFEKDVLERLLNYPVEIDQDADGTYRTTVETSSKLIDLLE